MSNEKTELDKVKIAYAEGKEIEFMHDKMMPDCWTIITHRYPSWSEDNTYRIKPEEPKYDKEFYETCKGLIGKEISVCGIAMIIVEINFDEDLNYGLVIKTNKRSSNKAPVTEEEIKKRIKLSNYEVKVKVCKGFEWFKENLPAYLVGKKEGVYYAIEGFCSTEIRRVGVWNKYETISECYDIVLPSGEIVPFITEEWVKA